MRDGVETTNMHQKLRLKGGREGWWDPEDARRQLMDPVPEDGLGGRRYNGIDSINSHRNVKGSTVQGRRHHGGQYK